ncbi:MAG: hypothetical protein KA361_00580 [Chromatiaceae bacterium]|nr:hypothetical protein [Chromatiaceae bacterium]MBP8197603.1 hypothetical protein [Chromatiaceae bacterium]MBP9602835.1 hypothetical protein [Chromatiaceae bacterium]
MNSLKLTMAQFMIQAFVSQLSETTIKKALASAIAKARVIIQESETEMDDIIILPVLEAIENALKLD